MTDHTLRAALAWALAGWAEADRCAEASAALAAECAAELADVEAERDVHRDRAVERLNEYVLVREAKRWDEIARDTAIASARGSRRRITIRTLHELADECAARGHRRAAQRLREAAAAVRDHDRPDGDGVGEGGA